MKKIIIISIIGLSLIIIAALLFSSILATHGQTISPIENIHGITFPSDGSTTIITESLAHADLYLPGTVLGKQLRLTVDFDPQNLKRLAVGVRENSFWLSYPQEIIYDASSSGRQTKNIVIPLTDKLQDANGSVDLMFLAYSTTDQLQIDSGVNDATSWKLYNLESSIENTWPSKPQIKNYLKGILKRERPL